MNILTQAVAIVKKILIYIAMQSEAQPIIDELNFEETSILNPALPMKTYTGVSSKHSYFLVTGGKSSMYGVDNVGTEPAAVGLQAALQFFDADLVINAGTAGGWQSKGAQIADVYLGKSPVRYHDHRIPIPTFEAYGKGSYPCIETAELAQLLNLKRGYISTSNSLDFNTDCSRLMEENKADCKEMEAAALAWICHLYAKPFLPIKAITDFVDHEHPTAEQFQENLAKTCLALKDAFVKILNNL
ncbi:hypothetical protein [Kangiella sp. HZ709]|uniref:phosphorylase family protein n=1 Tax=Kangiella sp. HZ709 TaxID=2666328 RepID=UPI0012B00298|nr:hypothetical protein [Kangiella sp. HZ709]MRX27985.1 hypothetical protein [Kangiella sp. HZ709]